MPTGVFQTSFAGGELSPNLYAREDIEKYASGAALMRNFYVDYRGGASNRPGTEYKAVCADPTGIVRLLPFIFSSEQSYILEFSDFLCRIYSTGGVPLADIITIYPASALFLLKYIQSADVMTIVHPDYPPYNLSRIDLTTFTFTPVGNGPGILPPENALATATNVGNLNYGYCITALTRDGEESLGSFPCLDASVALDPTHATPKTIAVTWDAVDGADVYNVYKWGPVPITQPLPTLFGYIGQTKTTSFTDTNIAADYSRVPPEYRDPFSPGQVTFIEVTSPGAGYVGYEPLTITGDGAGATGYGVSDGAGGITGAVLVSSGANYTTVSITDSGGGATYTGDLDLNNHYPSTVSYFQQRRVYGGADITPEVMVFSQIGAYENFDVSPAVLDTDAITVNIASRQVNTIKALVPMSTGLITFTTGMAFLVAGAGDTSTLTPASVSATPQASTGSNDIPPITVNYNILFVQQKGAIVRDMAFSFQTQSYYGVDRSMLANHLFFGYSIVDWAWAEEPYKLLWVVRNDGKCLVMTYVPDQEVYAWSQHDTNGLFKSVTTVPENDQDAVYFVVSRFIQESQVWQNYFERLSFRTCDCPADAAFLDSFVTLPRTAGDTTLDVVITGEDVTLTPREESALLFDVGDPDTFIMTAEENYDPEWAAYIDDPDSPARNMIYPEQINFALAVDRVRRKLMYPVKISGATDIVVNTTGKRLWSGATAIELGGNIFTTSNWNLWIGEKDLDTLAVVFNNVFSIDNLVPAGIGGSDGTNTARFIYDTARNGDTPNLVDPRTGDFWQHLESCELVQFRRAEANGPFTQAISPLQPMGGSVNVINPAGMSDDWVYAIEIDADDTDPRIMRMVPRTFQAEEIAADYKLSYQDYTFPFGDDEQFQRTCIVTSGVMYVFSCNFVGSGNTLVYQLNRFDPPDFAPFGMVTGGGFTDVTAWTSVDGPNGATAGYKTYGYFDAASIAAYYLPVTETLILLTLVQWFQLSGGVPGDLKMSCTAVDVTDETNFTTFDSFVTGWMTAEWVSSATIDDAAYEVQTFRETNTDLNCHTYDFTSTGASYTDRWIYFECKRVVEGVAIDGFHIVMVLYRFSAAAPPQVLQVVDENGFDEAYPAYGAAIGDTNVVWASLSYGDGTPVVEDTITDAGFVDPVTGDHWHSGFNDNWWQFDAAYTPRADFPAWVTEPFLRLSFGGAPTPIPQLIDIGCGTVRITGADGSTLLGVLEQPIGNEIPDDPFHVIAPIQAGDWFITDAANEIDVSHLKGMNVGLVVDGVVYAEQIVPDSGLITWPEAYATTRAVCGLPYQAQLQTMYLTTGEPTTQHRRKNIPRITTRVYCTIGMKIGPTFDELVEDKSMQVPFGTPAQHFTGDIFTNTLNNWNEYAQMCIQQDYPLPITVLGVIPQVVVGDNKS